MSGLENSTPDQQNNAVFESVSGSPMGDSASASGMSASAPLPDVSAPVEDASASLQDASAAVEAPAYVENASASAPVNTSASLQPNETSPENTYVPAPAPAPVSAPAPAPAPALPAPALPAPAPAPPAPALPAPAPRSEGRSNKQRQSDIRAKEFRSRINPEYLRKFENIPIALRPKGFPATAARQAIEMSPEEQNAFVNNVAAERRNAIEVKLGRKTRKVDSATLKDIENILKMAERSLIFKDPSHKRMIRQFGRETRKIARNYTSENINTLVSPTRATRRSINANRTPAVARTFRNKNNVVSSLEGRLAED
uniref:Uncharacterized protein n=1 Tax=viral metagenome TaxID=1070528 RepID=A0A6C0JUY2_9ZZZZ